MVAGPLAQPHTPGVWFAGLRTVAFDGLNSLKVPDTGRNRAWLGKIRHRLGLAGYPALRIMALAETGTRGLLGATLGSVSDRDETGLARRLLHLLRPGMLVLLDRAFDGDAFLRRDHRHRRDAAGPGQVHPQPAGPGAPARRLLPVAPGRRLDVRIIEAERGHDRRRRQPDRRLLPADHHADRPPPPIRPMRWSACITSGGRSSLPISPCGTPCWTAGCCARVTGPASSRRLWALLTLYQLLRMAMVTAVETRPGTNPDRASFTTALEAARDQLTAAAGICPPGPA